jgi:hypothetical protein
MNDYTRLLFERSLKQSKLARQSAANLGLGKDVQSNTAADYQKNLYSDEAIVDALFKISDAMGNSYLQITADFQDESRLTWDGTAHAIRELLRKLLEHLAPNDQVLTQVWYKQETGTAGPTQKQRVRYILEQHKSDSKRKQVVANIDMIDTMIGSLIRDVYGRASDAAHRSKDKTEAYRVLRYFDAFAHDLLNLRAS